MRYDAMTVQNAERKAFAMLTDSHIEVHPNTQHPQKVIANEADAKSVPGMRAGAHYVPNKFYSQKAYVTSPYTLIQEIPYTPAGPYQFNFTAVQAPPPSAVANNRVLSVNQTVCIYGFQILIGQGALAVNRYYRSYGIAINDNAIYNSTINMQLETNTLIDGIEGQCFRDTPTAPTESWDNMGLKLIQPLRIFNGDLGRLFINIVPNNSLAGLILTPNQFLSFRLLCVLGNPNIAK